jgi:hypothetical protein
MPLTRLRAAKTCGVAAGVGSILTAGLHQGLGGPEVEVALSFADGQAPAAHLAQVEASWMALTAMFVLIGVGLVMAGWRRPGWLVSLGGASAVWFLGCSAAFLWASGNWNVEGVPAQAVLLGVLGGLAGAAALLAAPRRPQ